MEKKSTIFEMITGLSLIVLSTLIYWNLQSFPTFMLSVITVIGGFFLTSSRILVLVEIGMHKKWWFWAIIASYAFLTFSFMPIWCAERVMVGGGFFYCINENFWAFFFAH